MLKKIAIAPFILSLAFIAAFAQAATPDSSEFVASPIKTVSGKLSLNAQASTEIPQDIVHILLFYEKPSSDPSTLTLLLKKKADQALRIAKAQNKVSVRTGVFSVYSSTNHDGQIDGWRGRTEIWLTSNDFAAAAQLAGQLSTVMSIGDVRFSLSPQAKQEAKTKLTAEAIAAFRDKAKSATQALGYRRYTINEVEINDNGIIPPTPVMMARTMTNALGADVPIEAGKTTVTVSVSGSVQMLR